MTESSKEFGSRYVGSLLGVARFIGDVFKTGGMDGDGSITSSIEAALLMEADRQIEFAQRQAINQDMAEAKAKAIANAREKETVAGGDAKAESDELSAADKAEEEIIRERKRRAEQREREAEAYEKASFSRMDPESQMETLLDRIAKSLGVDSVGSTAEIEAGAEALAGAGRYASANSVLSDLSELEAIAGRQGGERAVTSAGQGSLATLMDEIFGRNPAADQLEESRRAAEAGEKTVTTLDQILKKMDDPPPRDIFTDNL